MKNGLVISGTQVGGGGILMYLSSLDLASWSYIVGMLVAVVGLVAGLYWQWRKDRRADLVNKAVLESIKLRGVTFNEERNLD